MNKEEIPVAIQKKLDEFQVEVPEISSKRSKLDRFANWIYSPAKNPLELFNIKGNSITSLVFYPLIIILCLLFTPIFIM